MIGLFAILAGNAMVHAQPLVITIRQPFQPGVPVRATEVEARSRASIALLRAAISQWPASSSRYLAKPTEAERLAVAECLLKPRVQLRGFFKDGETEGVTAEAAVSVPGRNALLEGSACLSPSRHVSVLTRLRGVECALIENLDGEHSAASRKAALKRLEALQLLDRGLVFREDGRLREPETTLSLVREALELDSAAPAARYLEGLALMQLGRHGQATAALDREIASRSPVHWAYLDRAILRESGGDAPGALDDLGLFSRLVPGARDGELHLLRSRALFEVGRFDEALRECSRATEKDPSLGPAYALSGRINLKGLAYSHALKDFNAALRLMSPDADLYHARGMSYLGIGDTDAALQDLERAVALDPQNRNWRLDLAAAMADARVPVAPEAEARSDPEPVNPEEVVSEPANPAPPASTGDPAALPWVERSARAVQQQDTAEAVRCASRAIALDPGLPEPYIDRAWAYCRRGMFQKAYEDCSTAISIDPHNPVAYANRAWAAVRLGDTEQALRDCEAALDLDPENAVALNNRGLVLQEQGELRRAREDYRTACAKGLQVACENFRRMVGCLPDEIPRCIEQLLETSLEQFREGAWDKVVVTTTRVLDLKPDSDIALCNRAGAYANMGMLAEALEDCDRAIAVNPDLGLAYNNRGWVHELEGRLQEALLDYEIACMLGTLLGCQNYARIK